MNQMQRQVEEFMRAAGQEVGETPAIRDEVLRARLIEEEAGETKKALLAHDLVEAIDGLCDVLYVTFGAAVSLGIDIEPFYNEVHRTNMLKLTGPVREDGKRLKPEGWQPPRIAEMLAYIEETQRLQRIVEGNPK